MNNMSEFSNKLQNLISERNEYENVINDLCHIFGLETDRDDWLDTLLDYAKEIKKSRSNGVSVDTEKVIDATISAVELHLDGVYLYDEEPYLSTNDYEDEVTINLVKDEVRLDRYMDDVKEDVLDDLAKKEEPSEEESSEEKESPFSDDDKKALLDVIADSDKDNE